MATKDKKFGWHFLPKDLKLTFDDNRKVSLGKKLSIPRSDMPSLCASGMHASEMPSQAVFFRRGPVLCRVIVSGDIFEGTNKFCGRSRTVIWMKRITHKDCRNIARDMGVSYKENYDKYVSCMLANLASCSHENFDKAIMKLAKNNGWDDDKNVEVVENKPPLDEKTVLQFISDRIVRSLSEIVSDLSMYDADEDLINDIICDLVYTDEVCAVDNYDGRKTGYVKPLKSKNKKKNK